MSSVPYEQTCRRFSIDVVRSATRNFDEKRIIGKGGFGKVYTATIRVQDGESCIVAVKRLDPGSNQGAPEFWSEVEMLSKLRHCNLVSLIGYCNDNDELILIYELMTHGSLRDHLHKYGTNLSWIQRLKIGIGAARGLHYLHTGTGTKHGVIHRDVKSSNILLDNDFVAKISDFGLSKIGLMNPSGTYVNTLIRGTFGYFDPEYFLTGRLTRKSDVFAFGVVLFELLSGRVALSTSLDDDQCSLARWAHDCIEKGKVDQIVDKRIERQIFSKCLKLFVQIADRCLHSESKKRPTMAEIVVALELTLSLQVKFDNHLNPQGILAFPKWMRCFFSSPDDLHSAQVNPKPLDEEEASLSKEDSGGQLEVSPVGRIQILVHDLKMYSFREVKNATGDLGLNMRLGAGEFGEVFKGYLNMKTDFPSLADAPLKVAVKRLYHFKIQHRLKGKVSESCVVLVHFLDLTILRAFKHPNLVKLLGYCFENQKLFLIYEFAENGSLDGHLFTRSLQVKGNVHAFGVILVQILTGQHISEVDFANLRQTLNLKQESKESFMRALDPRLHSLNDATVKQALKMAALAFLCLDEPSYTLNQALDILRQL
ncbi:putative protein kinase RLK-Pelle-CrRLK1L-1 family [Helianthus debilis subsp. tardiflorus]